MIDSFKGGRMKQSIRDVAEVTQGKSEEQILAIPAAGRDLTLVSAAHAVIHAVAVLMPLIYPFIQKEYNQCSVHYFASGQRTWPFAGWSSFRHGWSPLNAPGFLWQLCSNYVILHCGCKSWYALLAHSTGIDSDGVCCICRESSPASLSCG